MSLERGVSTVVERGVLRALSTYVMRLPVVQALTKGSGGIGMLGCNGRGRGFIII